MLQFKAIKSKILRRLEDLELRKIKSKERYVAAKTKILGSDLVYVDSASFDSSYRSIFRHKIYNFKANSNNPRIIDCGANVGLSVVFFKRLYPEAKIVAFEPDKNIFDVLSMNVSSFSLADVQLINKAVWSEEKELFFEPDSADGGHVSLDDKGIKVQAVALEPYLREKVDFLKIDIEGAELEVLMSIKDSLKNVENIFIEYHSFVVEDQRLDTILNILNESGFRYIIHEDGKHAKSPFCHVDIVNGMDLQLSIFAKRGAF